MAGAPDPVAIRQVTTMRTAKGQCQAFVDGFTQIVERVRQENKGPDDPAVAFLKLLAGPPMRERYEL